MTGMRAGVTMHLHSGIPVVEMRGAWDEPTRSLLVEIVDRLVSAGHGEIIIDFTCALGAPVLEREWMEGLERLTVAVRTHRGRLGVVATVEQMTSLRRARSYSAVRWATSEEEAICHLKGIPMLTPSAKIASRLQ